MNQEERLLLIDLLLDGSISEADLLRIEAELSIDREVRQEYYRRLQLDMLLECEAAEVSPTDAKAIVNQSRSVRWLMILSGSLVAIAASVLLMVFANQSTKDSDSDARGSTLAASVEPSASGFAILNGQDAAVWSGTSLAEGDLVPAGELAFEVRSRAHRAF